ncbi:hypothetical protein OB08_04930 [Microbacterium sp. HJ5]
MAAGALAALVLAGVMAPALPTTAAWTDRETATTSTLTAGRVQPANQLACTAGIASPITFTWSAPNGGLTRTGYRWAVTGGLTASGTLAANATTLQLTSGLLGIGSGMFSLYAVGPGGWESTARTATVSFTTGLLSACTVT